MGNNKPLKLRIGMLGTGFIAGQHIECLQRVYGVPVEIVGVFDVIPEKGFEFARQHRLQCYAGAADLINDVDVVDICTPPFAHAGNILQIASAGKHILCEKPLIGYAPTGEEAENFKGELAPKDAMLASVVDQLEGIKAAVVQAGVKFIYFENFVYTPQVQKEAEMITKTRAQILRMIGEESHKGNHATYSSWWKFACGGSLISTGSHPMGAILYLKRVEGIASSGKPIRPLAVSARVHALTRIEGYRDAGFIRCNYEDVEDYAWAHVVFEDGTVGDVVTGATVLGGINDYVDVFANNHRTHCNINPVGLLETYNPKGNQFNDIYINYGISTNEGWLNPAPDENWMFGYQAEIQDAMECIAYDREPPSGLELAVDTLNVIYSAYLSAERSGQEVSVERI
jgi:predicted dehydrogenase